MNKNIYLALLQTKYFIYPFKTIKLQQIDYSFEMNKVLS